MSVVTFSLSAFCHRLVRQRSEGLADLLQPGRRCRRHDPLVRVLLGILHVVLHDAIRTGLAPVPGAVLAAPRGKHRHPTAAHRLHAEGRQQHRTASFGTSLYDLRQREMPPPADLTERDGLNLIAPEAALVKVPEICFVRNPVDVQVFLSGIPMPPTCCAGFLTGPFGDCRSADRRLPPHRARRRGG